MPDISGDPQFLSTLVAQLAAALATVVGAWWIAERYTKRLKRTDATLEFSKRYHELLGEAAAINDDYGEPSGHSNEARERAGLEWWARFFDLMLFEYHFYRQGLLIEELFVQWIWWRHFDFIGNPAHKKIAAGVGYKQGWEYYRSLPAMRGNSFIDFMDLVHCAANPRAIRWVVRCHRFIIPRRC